MICLQANWNSEAKLRSAQEIQRSFHESYSISSTAKISGAEQARICHDYATFADQQQASFAKSPELEQLYAYVDRKKAELAQFPLAPPPAKNKRDSTPRTEEEITYEMQKTAKHELEEDQRAIAQLLTEQTSYVKHALRMYAASLFLSDEHDDSTTRLCSLWLQHDGNEEINKSVAPVLAQIPSHKFIFLGPQLAARIDRPKKPTSFNTSLNGIMLLISRQHPYHILYQIITIASGMTLPNRSRRLSDAAAEGRGPAAAAILATLAADNGNPLARSAVKHMKQFSEAAIVWCLHKEAGRDHESWSGRDLQLPDKSPLLKLRDLSIPVATSPLPIDLVTKYAGIPTLGRYRSRYGVLGGVHRPKKMTAYDSLQRQHPQLVSSHLANQLTTAVQRRG